MVLKSIEINAEKIARLKEIELFLFDLDGTIYVGDRLIDGAAEVLNTVRRAGKRVCFLTNNSSKPRREYLYKLNKMGLGATDGELYTSAQATYEYLEREHRGKRIWLAATDGVKEDFASFGIKIVDDEPDAAVLAFDTSATYDKLNKFCRFLFKGAFYVATHADLNCPHTVSPMPDAGSFIEFARAATGRVPDVVCGKPYAPAAKGITLKYGVEPRRIAMVGDRLYTDIRFGNNFKFLSILVLTGEATEETLRTSRDKPDLTLGSVADLTEMLRRS
ncbi:MAG: HAD-IIA family hydrolase [Clostridiales bacterium]|jgi:HAD superfamily hydrolase (TIGR01450 family)|nr:HAD-IIA family hydrolase [Clostridiales bacterium]